MKQDMQSLKISRILEPVDSLVIFLNWLNSVLGTFLLIVINIKITIELCIILALLPEMITFSLY